MASSIDNEVTCQHPISSGAFFLILSTSYILSDFSWKHVCALHIHICVCFHNIYVCVCVSYPICIPIHVQVPFSKKSCGFYLAFASVAPLKMSEIKYGYPYPAQGTNIIYNTPFFPQIIFNPFFIDAFGFPFASLLVSAIDQFCPVHKSLPEIEILLNLYLLLTKQVLIRGRLRWLHLHSTMLLHLPEENQVSLRDGKQLYIY